jgi:hypothetical protein
MSSALTHNLSYSHNFVGALFRRCNAESSVTQPDLAAELSLRLAGERQSAVSDYQLHTEVLGTQLRPENQRILALLEEWYSTPDEMGEAWWNEFEEDLEVNRFSI